MEDQPEDTKDETLLVAQELALLYHQVEWGSLEGAIGRDLEPLFRRVTSCAAEAARRHHHEVVLAHQHNLRAAQTQVEKLEGEKGCMKLAMEASKAETLRALTQVAERGEKAALLLSGRQSRAKLRLVFCSWRAWADVEHKVRAGHVKAATWAVRNRRVARAFTTWAKTHARAKLEAERKGQAQRMKEVSSRIVAGYERELSRLRAELVSKREEVEKEREERGSLAKMLQRIVLRGLSTTNLEVLTVLGGENGGTQVDGDEPRPRSPLVLAEAPASGI